MSSVDEIDEHVSPAGPDAGTGQIDAPWWRRPGVVTLAPAALIFIVYVVNLKNSYDFSLDELTYASVTQQVIGHDAISSGTNVFLVHPPLYFLLGGLWNFVTGHQHDNTLTAVYSLRYFQALLVALTAWTVGLVTTTVVRAAGARWRLWQPVFAMAVFAFSGFVLSFGRAVLLESMAMLAGGLLLLAAIKLSSRPAVVQIFLLGALFGVACLVKQTVVFAALAPLLAALLRRDLRQIRIQVGAIAVGAFVWSSFLLWSATQGHGGAFTDQQAVSLRRLFGVLQTSGVNRRPGVTGTVSALDDVKATFVQYLAGYVVFLAGALALLVLLVQRRLFSRTDPLPAVHHLVLSFGVLQYVFVSFSFAFGQGNQQLIMYSAPAAAIAIGYAMFVLSDSGRHHGITRPFASVVGLLAVAGVVVGVGSWAYYYALHDDNGTKRMASYVTQRFPGCVAINASGNAQRWRAQLPAQNVRGFSDGSTALDQGVRLFLVSSKDASHAYGNMSPQLARFVKDRGTLLHEVESRSYGTIALFRIGPADDVTADPQPCRDFAARRAALPEVEASAVAFVGLLAGALVIVGGTGAAVAATGRRRQRVAAAGGDGSDPASAPSDDS